MEALINPVNMAFRLAVVSIVVERMKQNPEADVNDVFDSTWNTMLLTFKRRYQDNEKTIG